MHGIRLIRLHGETRNGKRTVSLHQNDAFSGPTAVLLESVVLLLNRSNVTLLHSQ